MFASDSAGAGAAMVVSFMPALMPVSVTAIPVSVAPVSFFAHAVNTAMRPAASTTAARLLCITDISTSGTRPELDRLLPAAEPVSGKLYADGPMMDGYADGIDAEACRFSYTNVSAGTEIKITELRWAAQHHSSFARRSF